MPAAFVRRAGWTVAAIGASVGAAFAFPMDGATHGTTLRLLGRMHPLVVHFPLGLLLLVPVLEVFGRRRPALREAAGFVLGLALIGAVCAVVAGTALARADAHEGQLVINHLWGGIAVALGTAVAWLIRERWRACYGVILLVTLGALGWAAHQGGSLTHGADYVTEPLPTLVKQWLRIREIPGPESYAPGTVFATAIQPVIEKHCVSCHGAEKQKGEYRMDSFAALVAGGKSGKPAIAPGQLAQSELLRRILLDPTDEKVMPPKKKPRPSTSEIAMLRWWIRKGASRDVMVADVHDAPPEISALLTAGAAEGSSGGEPAAVPRVGDYASLQPEIARLQRELGIKLVPVSRHAADGLILRARGAEAKLGDAEIAQLSAVAPFIVEAELAGTKITDAGVTALKAFTHLERLHLERTAVTGATAADLRGLDRLTYLNLCSTPLNDAGLAAIAQLTSLRQLYVFDSKATPAGVQSLRTKLPDCKVGPLQVKPEPLPAQSTARDDAASKSG